jgi:hypothetical protein
VWLSATSRPFLVCDATGGVWEFQVITSVILIMLDALEYLQEQMEKRISGIEVRFIVTSSCSLCGGKMAG